MAAVSLFWDINMAAVTSCENNLYRFNNSLTFVKNVKIRMPFIEKKKRLTKW